MGRIAQDLATAKEQLRRHRQMHCGTCARDSHCPTCANLEQYIRELEAAAELQPA